MKEMGESPQDPCKRFVDMLAEIDMLKSEQ
jgi:hypothetical protein